MRDSNKVFVRGMALLAVGAYATGAAGTDNEPAEDRAAVSEPVEDRAIQADATNVDANDAADAQRQVQEAIRVVNRMKQDPRLVQLLERAQGVFIIPDYGKAAAVVGGRGGQGVLLVRRENEWSSPAFFDFGSLTVGAQAGGTAGSAAMLLMNDRAVKMFRSNKNNFSLDANAGLTVMDYSATTEASAGKGDVIVWSDTKGLFAGVSIGVTDIRRDDQENRAYYSREATPEQILAGSITNPDAKPLRDALPDRVAGR